MPGAGRVPGSRRKGKFMRTYLAGILLLLVSMGPVAAQMVNPAIDIPGQPFSYASAPTDVIGIRDALAATEITPEGYLYTGFGELMFLTGYPAMPVAQRIRTLEK